jgi:hypothetical protein
LLTPRSSSLGEPPESASSGDDPVRFAGALVVVTASR